MSHSTPNHSPTDLRAIAGGAKERQAQLRDGLADGTLLELAQAEIVEDVLRYIVGDAPITDVLRAATNGRA